MQATLFPVDVKAKYVEKYPLADLPSDYLTVPPTATMIASVKNFGVLQPILLAGKRLVAGRRRIDASRKAGHKYIRALVFPEDLTDDAILALVENTNRRANPVNELHQVELLLDKKYTNERIRQETGMSKQTLDKLLLIRDKLIKPLRRALEDHIIGIGTAGACAKKSVAVQNKMLDLLEENGVLTRKDVDQACKVQRRQAVDALPKSLFGDDDDGGGWQDRFCDLIEEAKEVAKDGSERLKQLLAEVLKEV